MRTCGHCGRQADRLGGMMWTAAIGRVDLCHEGPQGCYHLVTHGHEQLGSRLVRESGPES